MKRSMTRGTVRIRSDVPGGGDSMGDSMADSIADTMVDSIVDYPYRAMVLQM